MAMLPGADPSWQASASALRESVWVVDGVFKAEECEALMAEVTRRGMTHAAEEDQPEGAPGVTVGKTGLRNRLRDCLRMEVPDPELAALVWGRVKHLVPSVIEISADPDCPPPVGVPNTKDLVGTWTAVGVNEYFRFVCYPGAGHFGPHRDGFYRPDAHTRSFMTLNGYLSLVPEGHGGATRFLKEDTPMYRDGGDRLTARDEDVLCAYRAAAPGSALLFHHALVHDGEPLKPDASGAPAPDKWLFRTDVMYTRTEDTAPRLTDDEVEARALYEEACEVEATDPLQAAKLYRRAFKKDPTLEAQLREL